MEEDKPLRLARLASIKTTRENRVRGIVEKKAETEN
jgi:hypothetical protein